MDISARSATPLGYVEHDHNPRHQLTDQHWIQECPEEGSQSHGKPPPGYICKLCQSVSLEPWFAERANSAA